MKKIFAFTLLCFAFYSCDLLQFEIVEKHEQFKPAKGEIKKIVVLSPDVYAMQENNDALKENDQTDACEKKLYKSFLRAGNIMNFNIAVPGITDNIDPDYFNKIARLKNEMVRTSNFFDIKRKSNGLNSETVEPLSANLILSPDFNELIQKYGTHYFCHTFIVEYNGLFMITVLADLSNCKIVYREAKFIDINPKQENLDRLVFNTFQQILK